MKADFTVDLQLDGHLKVTFPYDADAVQVIRTIPGRRWHKEQKFWTIPRASLKELRAQAGRHGIYLTLSDRTKQALNLGKERRKQLEVAKTDVTSLDLPTSTQAHPFQNAGIRFLKYALHNFRGALCADDMGLGKTLQALSIVALHEKLRNVLVIVPATLKFVWVDEIEKHYPQLTYTVVGGQPKERKLQWTEDSRIKICNYELLLRDVAPKVILWDLVIGDEITKIKNYQTKTAKLVKKLNRRYSLGLSGAPIENRLEELHSIFDFVQPGLLGSGWLFVQQHVIKDNWGKTLGYRGVDDIKEKIAPFYIRRRKSEVLKDLPDKVFSDVPIELSAEEWSLYNTIRNQIREEVKENPKLTVSIILTMMLRLKQAIADARLLGVEDIPSTKVATAVQILENAGEHKIVYYTQFAQFAYLLRDELGEEIPVIAGDVSQDDRRDIIHSFQNNGAPALISTEAGAYGVTLTAADVVVHLDQPWNPAKMRQREDRLHRIGQKNSVQVVSLMAKRTIDEHVRRILHGKMEIANMVLDDEIPDEGSIKVTRGELMSLLGDEE